ncbi:hypothetical protein TNCV_3555081 [Trichonephila clavipes]|nr:hypothetical protein TNCV_3555081 [Trichonephila clavipes]
MPPSGIVISVTDYCAVGHGFEFRRRHGFSQMIVPFLHGDTLNSGRATSSFQNGVKRKPLNRSQLQESDKPFGTSTGPTKTIKSHRITFFRPHRIRADGQGLFSQGTTDQSRYFLGGYKERFCF